MALPLFNWASRPDSVPAAAVPPGQRIYCVGDIHGRADLLDQLQAMMVEDGAGFNGNRRVVYLGDYIDRGQESRQVVDRLLDRPIEGFESIHLLGNHEQALLDFLQDPRAMAAWMNWGGRQTLASYGITLPPTIHLEHMELLARQLNQELPEAHLQFFKSLPSSYACGGYYFVHAGIRPGVALHKQDLGDKLWIREEFTRSQEQHPAVVVHGHSITPEVEILPNRIGIDTGAFYSGVLTALVLEGTSQRLLQTSQGAAN